MVHHLSSKLYHKTAKALNHLSNKSQMQPPSKLCRMKERLNLIRVNLVKPPQKSRRRMMARLWKVRSLTSICLMNRTLRVTYPMNSQRPKKESHLRKHRFSKTDKAVALRSQLKSRKANLSEMSQTRKQLWQMAHSQLVMMKKLSPKVLKRKTSRLKSVQNLAP
jgi:hypothetical protein